MTRNFGPPGPFLETANMNRPVVDPGPVPALLKQLMLELTGSIFAAIALVALIIYGDPFVRQGAIAAAILAFASQFTAQDQRIAAQRVSIGMAYMSFAFTLAAWLAFTGVL